MRSGAQCRRLSRDTPSAYDSWTVPSDLLAFDAFELDPASRRLLKSGEPVTLPSRQFDLLCLLVTHAGQVLSKDALVAAAWGGIAVTDNSVEQAISGLRRVLGEPDGRPAIETQPRRGYRFVLDVKRVERRAADDILESLLAPHRAWIEGRAALETLERPNIMRARDVFERVLALVPDQASAHVGLANACVMQFEMTRSTPEPDRDALARAVAEAREACRLEPRYGEAWATLGFVLDRTGSRDDALAALRMAVSLEADNWRHHLRLAYVGWGEERLREAHRTLALLPGFPMAHWLAATVHVARQAFDDAEGELAAGIASGFTGGETRFGSVALHWLLGLILLFRGDDAGALAQFDRELANESRGQLYARECCANTWYAIAVLRLRRGDRAGAARAIAETLERIPQHPSARAVLAHVEGRSSAPSLPDDPSPQSPEIAVGRAVACVLRGDPADAVRLVDAALTAAPPGSALWTLPLEPVLQPCAGGAWAGVLARLRNRAA